MIGVTIFKSRGILTLKQLSFSKRFLEIDSGPGCRVSEKLRSSGQGGSFWEGLPDREHRKGVAERSQIAWEGTGLVVAEVGVLGRGARRVKEGPESRGETPQS